MTHSKSHISGSPRGPGSVLRRLGSGLIPALLIGCNAMPITQGVAHAQDRQPLTDGQLMYEIMIAELAGRRGYLDIATAGYLRAAQRSDDPRVSERAARLAVWGRQWADAETAAERWLSLDPQTIEGQQVMAQVQLRRNQPARAADAFAAVVEGSDDRGAALNEIHQLLLSEPDGNQSLTVTSVLQSKYPEEVEAHLGMARLSMSQNGRENALSAVDQALEIDPDNSSAWLMKARILAAMGRPTEGFAGLIAALERSPDDVQLRLGFARLLVGAGRYDDAELELDRLFEQAPDNGDVLLTIGLLALDSRRVEAAKRYLTQLRETGNHLDQANFYLARIADQQQEMEQAIEFYEQVGDGELFVPSQIRAAELTASLGDIDVARERLQELRTTVRDPALLPQLIRAEGRVLQQGGEDQMAVDVLTNGLKQFPDNGELLYARALAADAIGDNEMLQEDLGKLIQAEPNNAHALNALGYFLADENIRLDEAEQYLVKAAQLLPDDPAILDSLGWLRFRQGDNKGALVLLQRAYDSFPDGEIAAHLGEVLWTLDRQDDAREVWNKALEISPGHEKLEQVMKQYMK